MLPELVCQIEDLPHRVVFIGNQSRHHKDHLMQSAQENKHDWMRDVGEAYMEAFAQFVVQMSAVIEHDARESGFEYIEIDNKRLADIAEGVSFPPSL